MSSYYVVEVDSYGHIIRTLSRHASLATAEALADIHNEELTDDSNVSYTVYDSAEYI